MKSLIKISCYIVFSLVSIHLQAQVIAPYLSQISYNTDVDYSNSDVNILNNHVIIDTLAGATSTITPIAISNVRGAIIDGYHLSSVDGQQYFSFDTDTKVNNIPVLKNDIIHCTNNDCSTFNFFFDSLVQGLTNVNINAFTIDTSNNQLFFSLENDGKINGDLFLASDIIRFNGSSFSLEYDSTANIFSRYKSIDGMSYAPEINKYLVSFTDEGAFNEIYELDVLSGNWQTAYTPLFLGDAYPFINLSSLNIKINQFIFKDSFE